MLGLDIPLVSLISMFRCQWSMQKDSLITDTHDTTTATEAIVEATKVDGANAELAQDRSTHDAWLDSDVQVRLLED
jgi:hypothetical protein